MVSFIVTLLWMKWMVRSPQMARYVFLITSGPCFVVLSLRWVMDIFTRVSLQGSLSLRDMWQSAESLCSISHCKEKYLKIFSSVKWKPLPPLKKAAHSLSNCVACASQFAHLQMGLISHEAFFFCHPESENECVQNMCAKCLQPPDKALQELAANLGYKSPARVKRIKKAADKSFLWGPKKM